MNTLCFIPAKGRSTRLPNKNKKKLNGKPLILYTVETALKCFKHSDIIVNTDSKKIRDIVLTKPIGVYMRTSEGKTIDDPLYAMLTKNLCTWDRYDTIIILQCTSPFLQPYQIKDCLTIFEKNKCSSLYSVGPDYKPNGAIVIVDKTLFLKHRSRDVEPKYLYLMDKNSSTDIDTQSDWDEAEKIVYSTNDD